MKSVLLGLAVAMAAVAASPPPSPVAALARQATILCRSTPLFVWPLRDPRPVRSHVASNVMLGQRFDIVSGPRTTLDSFQLLELDIPVSEPNYGTYGTSEHYWVIRDCVVTSR